MRYPFYIKITAILISLVLSVFIIIIGKNFLLPLVVSILISFLLYPFCKKLEKIKIPKVLAVVISILVVFLLLVILLIVISSQISMILADTANLNFQLNLKLSQLHQFFNEKLHISNHTLNNWIELAKKKSMELSGSFLSGTFSTTTEILTYFTLVPVYVFCFLLYRNSFKKFILSQIEIDRHNHVHDLLKKIQQLSQNYFIGLLSVIGLIGFMNTIGLWAIGLDHALFFGFFASMLTIIPYIGIFLGALLPITFALLTQDSIWITIGIVLVFSVVQILESNFITPKIIGSKVSINPFVAIVALLLGSEIWGAAGMILSIPCTAILKVIFDSMESTRSFGYFLGSELTEVKKDKAKKSAV